MPQDQARTTFTVPAGSGDYAPERLTLAAQQSAGTIPVQLLGVTILVESLPASATVELWLPKLNQGVPDNDNDYVFANEDLTAAGVLTVPLASWPGGAQIRVKSGGTAGSAVVSATAD